VGIKGTNNGPMKKAKKIKSPIKKLSNRQGNPMAFYKK
jgi:hypothetical protein